MSAEDSKPETHEDEILDFEEEEEAAKPEVAEDGKGNQKGSYTNLHTSSFKDFVLKAEVLRAITDCGFEHPSEVQHECIPQAILGVDVLCQAKSGMGKTAVFVLSVLHQMEPTNDVQCVVLAHTRDLALQISNEFERFSKYLPSVRVSSIYGGVDINEHKKLFADKEKIPNVVCGSPGRVLALVRDGSMKLDKVKYFVLDECDKMLEQLDMRRDVQEIFKKTPHSKQVMMFSATLSEKIRPVCKKFLRDPIEVFVDSESKLTLHGLLQYYVQVAEEKKLGKLTDLLDALEFNQVMIFTKSVQRATKLSAFLCEQNFPSICIHSSMPQAERTKRYLAFKNYEKRILVSTDLFARGIDVERVNIVMNFDMPQNSDTYLHRVGRAGRFGTKGLAITFVSTTEDGEVLNDVQSRFVVNVPVLPDTLEADTYMPSYDN